MKVHRSRVRSLPILLLMAFISYLGYRMVVIHSELTQNWFWTIVVIILGIWVGIAALTGVMMQLINVVIAPVILQVKGDEIIYDYSAFHLTRKKRAAIPLNTIKQISMIHETTFFAHASSLSMTGLSSDLMTIKTKAQLFKQYPDLRNKNGNKVNSIEIELKRCSHRQTKRFLKLLSKSVKVHDSEENVSFVGSN